MHGFMFDVVQGQSRTGEERLNGMNEETKVSSFFESHNGNYMIYLSQSYVRECPRELPQGKSRKLKCLLLYTGISVL